MSLCYCAMGDGRWVDGMGEMSASEQNGCEVGMHQKEKKRTQQGRGEQRD